MPSTYETRLYDIHLSFEPQYDETPRLYAHRLFKDHNGEWNVDSQSHPDDSYYLSEQEAQELARNLGYEDFYDLQLDEWFSNIAIHTVKYLPQSVRFWIGRLDTYITDDLSADTREMENA